MTTVPAQAPVPEPTATASVPGGKSKDARTVKVHLQVACCYREHKYPAEDPRSRCHLGLQKLDFAICPNCVWFGEVPSSVKVKLLSGGEAMAVAGLLRQLRETHDADTGQALPPAEGV